MNTTIFPCFSVDAIYAKKSAAITNIIQDCINQLRCQGFRVHDSGIPGCPENYLTWINDSDVILVFCTPGLIQYGDQLFITEKPSVRANLQKKTCIPVLIQGTGKESIPEWAEGTALDCRDNSPQSEFDLYHMEIPLGNMLRRIELKMLDAMASEEKAKSICLDSVSVNRRRKLQRFILHNRSRETFVRVLLALGPGQAVIHSFPEWVVYEDPDCFAPDNNKEVILQLAHVGNRVLNPSSKNYGAYHLDEPISFQVPERLLYHDHQELVKIASSLLEQQGGTYSGWLEASLDDLYLMDMELNVPFPDEETIRRDNLVWADQKNMEKAIDFWRNP